MGDVIKMTASDKLPTKTISGKEGEHRYTCQYDPHAPANQRWVWHIDYVQTYRFIGSAPTPEKAASDARRKIHSLNKHHGEGV